VREEEIDWCVYRVIADGDAKTLSEAIRYTHLGSAIVEASVQRLIHTGLIARTPDRLRILPFQETLIHRQIQAEADCPVYLDDGVIKLRDERENTI
jgi:hypothetical protein